MVLVLGTACSAVAQGFLYVPNGLGNVEGNSSVSSPFTSSSFRMQMVFDASQFGGQTIQINSISFRIDGASSGNVLYSYGGSTVQLSTTTRTPDSLSLVFDDNIGPNVTTIFSGAAAVGGGYQPGANPQPFGNSILATTPFIYSPSMGNLLLDIRAGGTQILFPGAIDAESTLGDSISRVFANSSGALSGTADSAGLITRFGYTVSVPEPASITLVLTALGTLLVSRCFRKR